MRKMSTKLMCAFLIDHGESQILSSSIGSHMGLLSVYSGQQACFFTGKNVFFFLSRTFFAFGPQIENGKMVWENLR